MGSIEERVPEAKVIKGGLGRTPGYPVLKAPRWCSQGEETKLDVRGRGRAIGVLGSPRLRWTDSAGPHSIVVVRRVVAGSAAGVGLVVSDPAVSRLHAELEPRAAGLWVRDLGSRNGTFIDGAQIFVGTANDEGQIRLGSIVLRVSYERAPERPNR